MSKLFVDEIQPKTTGGIIGVKGHVLQVEYFQLTTPQTESVSIGDTDMAVTNFNVIITPNSTSSIIKLEANIMYESANAPQDTMWFFYRNTTKLGATGNLGSRKGGISSGVISYRDNNASTPEFATLAYFDQPQTTSAITYKLGVITSASNSLFINRTVSDLNSGGYERGVSLISATEIGG